MSHPTTKQGRAPALHVGPSVLRGDVLVLLTFQLRPKHFPVSALLTMKEGDEETRETLTFQLEDPGRKKQPGWLPSKKSEKLGCCFFLGRVSWTLKLVSGAVKTSCLSHQIWETGGDTFWTTAILNGECLTHMNQKKVKTVDRGGTQLSGHAWKWENDQVILETYFFYRHAKHRTAM